MLVDAGRQLHTVARVTRFKYRAGVLAAAIGAFLALSASPALAALSSDAKPATPDAPAASSPVLPQADTRMEGTRLVSAWPEPGFVMWQPPRQGKLVFEKPVDAATLTIRLEVTEGEAPEEEITRLTKGTSEEIKFSIPVLTGPASFSIVYSGMDAEGNPLAGSIPFGLDAPFETVGGGNHRHGAEIHRDYAHLVLLRALFVWAAALAFLSVWRARRGRRSVTELVLPRLSGLMLAVASGAQAVLLLSDSLESYYETPLLAVAASPGFWIFLPLAGAGLLQVIAGRRDVFVAAVAAAVLLSVVASTTHSTGLWGALQSAGYALVLVAAAAFIAVMLELGSRLWSRQGSKPVRLGLLALASALVLSSLSLLMVVLHAQGFVILGDFVGDLTGRVTAASVLLAACGVAALLTPAAGRTITRVLTWPVVAAALASGTYLLWLPPPTSGL